MNRRMIIRWWNFKTGDYEPYTTPETDEQARDHLPRRADIHARYDARRAAGGSIPEALIAALGLPVMPPEDGGTR